MLLLIRKCDSHINFVGYNSQDTNRSGGENVYHLDLDLSPEEVKRMKQLALDRDLSVKEMVTRMVKYAINVKTDTSTKPVSYQKIKK